MDQLNTGDDGSYDPLYDSQSTHIKIWFDDIILSSDGTADEHLAFVSKVIERLARIDVRINLKKSEFLRDLRSTSVKVLGYVITNNKVLPDPKKIECIKNMRHPKSTKEVQILLGHVTFIRNLLPLRAMQIVSLFSHLASPKAKFDWTPEFRAAFEELKDIISSDKVYVYVPASHTIKLIYSDASQRLFAANCYSLDLYKNPREKIGAHPLPAHYVPLQNLASDSIPAAISKHFHHFDLQDNIAIAVTTSEYSSKTEFMMAITDLYNYHHQGKGMENSTFLERYLLMHVDLKITYLLPLFQMDRQACDEFLSQLTVHGLSDELFDTYFEIILQLTASILDINIGLSFCYTDRLANRPFVFTSNRFHLAPYLLAVHEGHFYSMLNTHEIVRPECQIPSSLDIFLSINSDPDEIYSYFTKIMKDEKLSQSAQIVGHFSSTIPLAERNRPIFEQVRLLLKLLL